MPSSFVSWTTSGKFKNRFHCWKNLKNVYFFQKIITNLITETLPGPTLISKIRFNLQDMNRSHGAVRDLDPNGIFGVISKSIAWIWARHESILWRIQKSSYTVWSLPSPNQSYGAVRSPNLSEVRIFHLKLTKPESSLWSCQKSKSTVWSLQSPEENVRSWKRRIDLVWAV